MSDFRSRSTKGRPWCGWARRSSAPRPGGRGPERGSRDEHGQADRASGAGNIGEADQGPAPAASSARTSRRATPGRAPGADRAAARIRPCADNATLVRESDVIVLAVKPNHGGRVRGGRSRRGQEQADHLAGGGRLHDHARQHLPHVERLIASCPIPRPRAGGRDRHRARRRTGKGDPRRRRSSSAPWARRGPDEEALDAVTGLRARARPTYIVIESLADGGVKMGSTATARRSPPRPCWARPSSS